MGICGENHPKWVNRIGKVCEYCGEIFYLHPFIIKNSARKYCSRKCSELGLVGKYTGENHPNWKGGISFQPYCQLFNTDFKTRVRVFFDNKCVECGKTNKENCKNLCVHHVNYEKSACCDDVEPLFVSLCSSCHSKTNTNREYWEEKFTNLIMEKYNGKCYYTKEEMVDVNVSV